MISASNVALSYGKRVIFKDVNIKFTRGNCYGLIGANGAGKSTFLKILAGEIEPDRGTISVSSGERIAVLSQDQFAFDEETVYNTVIMGHERLYELMAEREAILTRNGPAPLAQGASKCQAKIFQPHSRLSVSSW